MCNLRICSVFLCQTPIYFNHIYFSGTLDAKNSKTPKLVAADSWQNDFFQFILTRSKLKLDLFDVLRHTHHN